MTRMANPDMQINETETEKLISIKVEDPYAQLANSLEKMIHDLSPASQHWCIYRTPKEFREVNPKAFTPRMVSIGPLHHGNQDLQAMEKHKVAYLSAFLARSTMSLETCIKVIREWENRIRNCYAERVELESDDFVKMILLDSCFVIEAIWRYNNSSPGEKVIDYLDDPSKILAVMTDMILLENLLPFFVLEGLFNLAFPSFLGTEKSFTHMCMLYFATLILTGNPEAALKNISRQELVVKHFLDLLRICHAPSTPRRPPADYTKFSPVHNAKKLATAGITFKRGPSDSSVTDIRCKASGVIEIPGLVIIGDRESLLRNLIAYELCHHQHDSYILDYVYFMNSLIDSSKDVELLSRQRIVHNFLTNNNEVAALFNSIKPTHVLTNYYYHGLCEDMNAYCEVPWHKWKATLKRDYCSSPWLIASTVAATLLLICTIIQTVASVISDEK